MHLNGDVKALKTDGKTAKGDEEALNCIEKVLKGYKRR